MKTWFGLVLVVLVLVGLVPRAWAEETVTPLGNRWYHVEPAETFTVPDSGIVGPVVVCLDDVPGGIESFGAITVKPLSGAHKKEVVVRRTNFWPGEPMPYASVIFEAPPGSVWQVKVTVRGNQ